VSPTFSVAARAAREYTKLNPQDRARFTRARIAFVDALRADGRATFEYGDEQLPGEPHVYWRRVGSHSILSDP